MTAHVQLRFRNNLDCIFIKCDNVEGAKEIANTILAHSDEYEYASIFDDGYGFVETIRAKKNDWDN